MSPGPKAGAAQQGMASEDTVLPIPSGWVTQAAPGRRVWARARCVAAAGATVEPEALVAWLALAADLQPPVPCCSPPWRRPLCQLHQVPRGGASVCRRALGASQARLRERLETAGALAGPSARSGSAFRLVLNTAALGVNGLVADDWL